MISVSILCHKCAFAINILADDNEYDYIVVCADTYAGQGAFWASLHPELRACVVTMGDVRAAFAGNDALRQFAVYAYEHWRIAPTYLLLLGSGNPGDPQDRVVPTTIRTNSHFDWGGLNEYATDDVIVSGIAPGVLPLMHVGRQTMRLVDGAAPAFNTQQYLGLTSIPLWTTRLLSLVGDVNPINEKYRNMSLSVETEIAATGGAKLFGGDYEIYEDPTGDVRTAWNAGVGIVSVFGNTYNEHVLAFLARTDLPAASPDTGPEDTFTFNLLQTGYTPVVFATTCFTNWFHRSRLAFGEELLGWSGRGAVAVVGPTHQVDVAEASHITRGALHELFAVTGRDVDRTVGRLLTVAKVEFARKQLGHAEFGEEYVLLGDPALPMRTAVLPQRGSFQSSFEITDPFVLQNRVAVRTGGVVNDRLRALNRDGDVVPHSGERMIRASLIDVGGTAEVMEWRLFEGLSVPIVEESMLTFWMNVAESPSANGHVSIDLVTSEGTASDNVEVMDQTGQRLKAGERGAVGTGWRCYYAALEPISGSVLQEIRLRYDGGVDDVGDLTVYIDDIRVGSESGVSGATAFPLLNVYGQTDGDGDGGPDYWTDMDGQMAAEDAQIAVVELPPPSPVLPGGVYDCLGIRDSYGNGGGARQVFFMPKWKRGIAIQWGANAATATNYRVRLRDMSTGVILNEATYWCPGASVFWGESIEVFNPTYTFAPARVSIEITPLDPTVVLYVRGFLTYLPIGDAGNDEMRRPVKLLKINGNPMVAEGSVRIVYEVALRTVVGMEVLDIAGRRVAKWDGGVCEPGGHAADVTKVVSGLGSGVYMMCLTAEGRRMDGAARFAIIR